MGNVNKGISFKGFSSFLVISVSYLTDLFISSFSAEIFKNDINYMKVYLYTHILVVIACIYTLYKHLI